MKRLVPFWMVLFNAVIFFAIGWTVATARYTAATKRNIVVLQEILDEIRGKRDEAERIAAENLEAYFDSRSGSTYILTPSAPPEGEP